MRHIASSLALVVSLSCHAGAKPYDFCETTKKMQALGIIKKVDSPGGRLPHVWVGRRFWALDYDQKANAIGIATVCYMKGADPNALVIVRDGMTGKRIGNYRHPSKLTLDD